MGVGGLGIGDWAQSPIPNPQSPIPNPHLFLISYLKIYKENIIIIIKIIIYFL
jgi:hypothetical protein